MVKVASPYKEQSEKGYDNMSKRVKHFYLQHRHHYDWWGLGERTKEQVDELLEMAQDIVRTEHEISFRLKDLFDEPLFRVLIVEEEQQ
jgi:hypothetical protein